MTKRFPRLYLSKQLTTAITFVVSSFFMVSAQNLPTAKSIAAEMGITYNIGNSLEVPKDPLLWGNPLPTQAFIDSVKAGGFKTIRIPCAWNSHADTTTLVINASWLNQVKTIVDYCIKDSLFVVLNSHWDGGWLEERIATDKKDLVNKRQGAYWRQIATTFRNYDRHLLFASANEPAVQDPYGTAFGEDRMAVLLSYHQTFVDSVRATGGNNASRTLIVQGPRSDIELTNKVMNTLPTDKIADRMMAEVHFYPYQFCLMETDADWGKVFYYWGKNYHSTTDTDRNSTWCEEAYVDSMFKMMKTQFVDKNIPVLLGEFGAMKRLTLTGDSLTRHILSRRAFYEYVVSSCKKHGLIPAPWDAGNKGNLTMTIFDRKTGGMYDLGLLNAIRNGWGLSKLPGDTSLVQVATGDNSMKILYSAKDSARGQVILGVLRPNMTTYDSIKIRAYVNGEMNYDSLGTTKNGWLSINVVTMSKNWTWRQADIGKLTLDNWGIYTIPIGTDTTNKSMLAPADPAKIDHFSIQAYSRGYRGTIYIDWIVFKTKTGTSDTVYSFNLNAPEEGNGNVESVKLIPTSNVPSDIEWKTATKKIAFTSTISPLSSIKSGTFHVAAINGKFVISCSKLTSGAAQITLMDLQGKVIASRKVSSINGTNVFELPATYHGTTILQIQQGNQKFSEKIMVN